MFSNLKTPFLILALMLSLSGCGDLLGTKVVKRQLDGSQFAVECKLEVDNFAEIMHENISKDIRCLGEQLNLFIKIVKSGKPGYLSLVQLESYIKKFKPEIKPEVVKALSSIFQLGHLITGEDPNYISKETVDKVISFALVFNEQAAMHFSPIFKNDSPVTYALHRKNRDDLKVANQFIIQSILPIFKSDRNGQIHKLNIIELLEAFTTDSNRSFIEKAKKVLFLKGILLGGKNDEISHLELFQLITNFNRLTLIALDLARYQYIILNQDSILQLLKADVTDLYEMVTQGPLNNRDQTTLFTVDEAIAAAKLFIKKTDFDVDKYRNLIVEFKKLVMKGNAVEVKGFELKNLFNHSISLLQTGTVFHRIYEMFKAQLSSPNEVNIDFSQYRHTYPEHQFELNEFERIVKKYRFMKGEFLSSYYNRDYKRNANAMFEIAAIEYVLKLIFSTYGSPSPNDTAVGGYSINKEQMQNLMKKFENELIDLGLILPQRAVTTADNISLLGSLFQYQSDTNEVMDINEATEFAETVFTSLNVADDIFGYMLEEEQNCGTKFERLKPECLRTNFWKGLCTYYRQYYPLLFQSLNAPAKCEDWENTTAADEYLDRAIRAGRSCMEYTDGDKEEIPYTKGDIMTLMVVLLHSETTIIRWDLNKNNIMDEDEVMKAYAIYSPALDGFLKGKSPIIKRFKKQIYQYMIKYEKVPDEKDYGSIWNFIKFLMSFNKKAPANRKTIASLLVAIGEQNAAMQTTPKFDCNLLRNPDDIPRGSPGIAREVDKRPNYSFLLTPHLYLTK